MSDKRAGADTNKSKMKPRPESQPGLEFDGHGDVIPLEKRTPEAQAKSIAAGEKSGSIKNPEQEAEHPAPMLRDQQGQAAPDAKSDPAGQQGGQRQ